MATESTIGDEDTAPLTALRRAAFGRCPSCGSAAMLWSPDPTGSRCHTCGDRFPLARADKAFALAVFTASVLVVAAKSLLMTWLPPMHPMIVVSFLGMAVLIGSASLYTPLRRGISAFRPIQRARSQAQD